MLSHVFKSPLLTYSIRLGSFLLFPILLMAIEANTAGLQWDLLNTMGFLAFGLSLLLFFELGKRRENSQHRFKGLFYINLHRFVAYVVLGLAVGHSIAFLVLEPVTINYILLSAPMYMLAGLAALIVLLVLVLSSETKFRRFLFDQYKRFKYFHAVLAVLYIVLVWVHLAYSKFYLTLSISLAFLSMSVCVSLAAYYLSRRSSFLNRQKKYPRDKNGNKLPFINVATTNELLTKLYTITIVLALVATLAYPQLLNYDF